MTYNYFNYELFIDNGISSFCSPFETEPTAVRSSMEKFNKLFFDEYGVRILPYIVEAKSLRFILGTESEEISPSLPDKFREILAETIQSSVWNKKSKKFPELVNAIQIRQYKRVNEYFCIRAFAEGLIIENKFLRNDDLNEFMRLSSSNAQESKKKDGMASDKESSENGIDGIFDRWEDIDKVDTEYWDEEESASEETDTTETNKESEMELHFFDAFEKEMFLIDRFGTINKKLIRDNNMKRIFPFHYVLTIEPSMGLTTVLKKLAENLYKSGMIHSSSFMEYNGRLSILNKEQSDHIPAIFTRRSNGTIQLDEDEGIIAVNISKNISDPSFSFERFMDMLWKARGRVVCVMVVNGGLNDANRKLLDKIKSSLNIHHIHFSGYSNDELLTVANGLLHKYGLKMDQSAEMALLRIIEKEKTGGTFEHLKTLQKIIEEVRVEKIFKDTEANSINILNENDFAVVEERRNVPDEDAWKELEGMVGLDAIKQLLKEIINNARIRMKKRELGLETEEPCYHMMFLGNPGTGKTMVARIVSRLFKQIGILKKGELHEVARDNLIGKYIGYTAPLVAEQVNAAMGSVLFIDEAYSLNCREDNKDYGYEAIQTLIKEMENKRSNLIVIMAGYTKEMKELLTMNPGLNERIPYKIEFPDYNVDELIEIFRIQLGKGYVLCDGVIEKIKGLFETAVKNADSTFGNGRLARNLAEKLKMKQSMRLYREEDLDRDTLAMIKMEDVRELCCDEGVIESIGGRLKEKLNIIGFNKPN